MLTKTTFGEYNVTLGVPIHVVCTCRFFVQFFTLLFLLIILNAKSWGKSVLLLFHYLTLYSTFLKLKDVHLFSFGHLS